MNNLLADPRELSEEMLSRRRQWVFLLIGGIFGLLVIVGIVMAIVVNTPPTRIILNYAPESATVTVNGVAEDRQVLDLAPGKYDIEVTKYGFKTFSAEIELERFETETVFAILEPDTVLTENWYSKDLGDNAILDGKMSFEYDNYVQQMVKEFPVVEKLPFKSREFEIYYGVCGEGSCEIIIKSDLAEYDMAVRYFYRNLDSELGRYRFRFINYGNQFQGERDGVGA